MGSTIAYMLMQWPRDKEVAQPLLGERLRGHSGCRIASVSSEGKKVKCTLVQALRLCTGRTAHGGSRGIALPFHDSGTRRGEGSVSRPGRSLLSGKTRYPLYRRLGGPQGLSGRAENLAPPKFDPRTIQPVASRYTDYATWSVVSSEGFRKIQCPVSRRPLLL